MVDELTRSLNEAVLPTKQEAEDARNRLTVESWAPEAPKAQNGRLPIEKEGNAEWGIKFGGGNDDKSRLGDEAWRRQQQNLPLRQGKGLSVYVNLKF